MNADIPPLKVWLSRRHLTQDDEEGGFEAGYAFAIQSYKGRALQFHVLLQSGAHFRHIPLHWLCWQHTALPAYDLPMLQLWDCFSYKPVVNVLDLLRDYSCVAVLRDKTKVSAKYFCTIDWLPDDDCHSGFVLQPDQNKCAHLLLLENGQLAALPTNRVIFKDAFFIGNAPDAATRGYKTVDNIWTAETSERWSVAETDETFY
jgi:hypothetical protein